MDKNVTPLERALRLLPEILQQDTGKYSNIFLVTDLNGKVAYSFSNQDVVPQHSLPGSSWAEKAMGFNALSLAMKSGKLSQVRNQDHSNQDLKRFFSVASPFRDEEGNLFGYLVLLSDETEGLHMANKYAVKACVKYIESQLQVNAALKNLEIKNKFENAIINSIHDNFLVLYPDGIISYANKRVAETFGVEPEQLTGRKITDFAESKLFVLDVFKTGQPILNKEVFFKMRNGKLLHIIMSAVPVHDEEGKVIAVIDNVKEIKEVRNLVNRVIGAKASYFFEDIIYQSKVMAATVKMAETAAKGPLSVLLLGGSGTGKELFAQAIHNASPRNNGPFVIIDCAAIPRDLAESELFGYVEGSFTGARKGGRLGKFELANGGTVFLDEIGELPLEIQAKFLRALQNHCFVRVGGSENIPVDIRVIAATNRDLLEEVKQGNFREDLFYRLNILTIDIPPLCERVGDIPLLVDHFMFKFGQKLEKEEIRISREAMMILKKYAWPGNVRELENAIGRAVNFCDKIILPEHLPQNIRSVLWGLNQELIPGQSRAEMEKRKIVDALLANNGNRVRAAHSLGIARSTLYKKMEYFGANSKPIGKA